MRRICLTVLMAAGLAVPGLANAQAAWDAPLLLPPRPQPGIGIFLADMAGGGLGILGTWRSPTWDYGLRFGLAEGSGDEDLTVFGGADFMGPINTATSDFPLDIDWVVGAGAGIGNGVLISVPAGLTLGFSFQGEDARFIPYFTPRVILDAAFGNDTRDSELDLGVAVDLGLDLRLMRGGPLAGKSIRFGASIGDHDALAVGIVF
ncbi:MAG TPA: hypothetical protein VK933_08020 [Longimicrobiales bacterium]|nr:hypothetical protein [Longimicrobiales bacterium]